ncbi:MAG: hypothetical protein BroJett030_21970 [Alphaproteobacteria bacterium]|nr:MAG: hypothetical protein BroJett030_21970 [Alphaproteobacteria bacterium]
MRGFGTDARLISALLATLLAAAAPTVAAEIPVPTPRPGLPAVATAPAAEPRRADAADVPVPHRRACPAMLWGRVEAAPAPVREDGACGADSPLTLISAAGVALTGRPTVTCEMAGQLARLAEEATSLARRLLDGELAAIVTGPGYECRRRNRAAAGKLSEHAFANALDIAAFRLADGREVTVAGDWPRAPATAQDEAAAPVDAAASGPRQAFLKQVHAAACRHFTTVLGPDSDTAHEAHLHVDLGCHGSDCRYLICQ